MSNYIFDVDKQGRPSKDPSSTFVSGDAKSMAADWGTTVGSLSEPCPGSAIMVFAKN